jgi:hypothetical protein
MHEMNYTTRILYAAKILDTRGERKYSRKLFEEL